MGLRDRLYRLFGKQKSEAKRDDFLDFVQPDAIFDVGANIGMSAQSYLNKGFQSTIYSFEPVSHLFEKLKQEAIKTPNWKAINIGIGDKKEQLKIHVSGGHGGASSFLKMTEDLKRIAPDQEVVRDELVNIDTLENFYRDNKMTSEQIFLKIDVQGFEMKVLKGAIGIMDKILAIKIETSIVKQYENESDIFEILPYLLKMGYSMYKFEDGWRDPNTKELLQTDIYLFRSRN